MSVGDLIVAFHVGMKGQNLLRPLAPSLFDFDQMSRPAWIFSARYHRLPNVFVFT
jgi:hypothetical protein